MNVKRLTLTSLFAEVYFGNTINIQATRLSFLRDFTLFLRVLRSSFIRPLQRSRVGFKMALSFGSMRRIECCVLVPLNIYCSGMGKKTSLLTLFTFSSFLFLSFIV